jgi:hypothetical protein
MGAVSRRMSRLTTIGAIRSAITPHAERSVSVGSESFLRRFLSNYLSPALGKQVAQQGAMAARFALAVAAHGEVGLMRQCGQQVKGSPRLRPLHLREEASPECLPGGLVFGGAFLQQGLARRQGRKPHVVDVAARVLGLGHTPRGTADRPNPNAFGPQARAAKSDDMYCDCGSPIEIDRPLRVRVRSDPRDPLLRRPE